MERQKPDKLQIAMECIVRPYPSMDDLLWYELYYPKVKTKKRLTIGWDDGIYEEYCQVGGTLSEAEFRDACVTPFNQMKLYYEILRYDSDREGLVNAVLTDSEAIYVRVQFEDSDAEYFYNCVLDVECFCTKPCRFGHVYVGHRGTGVVEQRWGVWLDRQSESDLCRCESNNKH